MTPLFHPANEVFEKMHICRVVDIDNNSHGSCIPSLKKDPVREKKGLATRIALFCLSTIKNDPAATVYTLT
jgi:hypothetical protein